MDRQLIQTKLFHSNLYTGEINFPSDLIHNVINLKNSVESVAFSNRGGWQSPSYTSYTSNEFMHSVLVDITEHLIPVYDSYGIDSLPALSNYWFNVNDKFGEPFFDGGIVEVSVNQMVHENIEKVGSFISGSYNGIIYGWENNLSNQNGFVEKSNGKITSAIKLSPDLKDSVIQLCFWIGTDLSGGDLGWNISSISVAVPRCGGSCDDGCQDSTDGCNACSK